MVVALILLAQQVFGPPVPIDLRKPVARSAVPCSTTGEDGEIVVCGRRPDDQRLGKLPEPAKGPLPDEISFRLPGHGKANVHAIQSSVGGFTGQGMAVTLTVPFGKGKKD